MPLVAGLICAMVTAPPSPTNRFHSLLITPIRPLCWGDKQQISTLGREPLTPGFYPSCGRGMGGWWIRLMDCWEPRCLVPALGEQWELLGKAWVLPAA